MSKPRTLSAEISTSRTAIPATRRFEPISIRIDDAAEVTGISDSKLKRLVSDKAIPSFMIDGCRLILWEDLRSFVYRAAGRAIACQCPPGQPDAPEDPFVRRFQEQSFP